MDVTAHSLDTVVNCCAPSFNVVFISSVNTRPSGPSRMTSSEYTVRFCSLFGTSSASACATAESAATADEDGDGDVDGNGSSDDAGVTSTKGSTSSSSSSATGDDGRRMGSEGDDEGDGMSDANGVTVAEGEGDDDGKPVTDGSMNDGDEAATTVGVTVMVSQGDLDGEGDCNNMISSSSLSSNTGGVSSCCCCCTSSFTDGDSNGGTEGSPPTLGMISSTPSSLWTGSHVTAEMNASPTDGVNTIDNISAEDDRSIPGNNSTTGRYGMPPPAEKTSRLRTDRVSFACTTTSKTRAPATNAGG